MADANLKAIVEVQTAAPDVRNPPVVARDKQHRKTLRQLIDAVLYHWAFWPWHKPTSLEDCMLPTRAARPEASESLRVLETDFMA
jgi:hypothetical protein